MKFIDLNKQYQSIKLDIDNAIKKTIENSSYIGGEDCKLFEKEFANFQDAKYCIGVANGTDALEIALEALDLKKETEVIVPVNSFISSSEAVTRCGYKVTFCDIDKETNNIDIASLKEKINQNTSALIMVHLYGNPAPINEIMELAVNNNIKVIEDCAQAHGAEYFGKRVGSFGDMGCFSFYPGKNLGAYGDGGAILTNNKSYEIRARMISNHGRIDKYNHEFEGRNSRLDGLQAAILRVKLKYLENWILKRNHVANRYIKELSTIKEISIPSVDKNCRHAFHLFVIKTLQRDALIDFLTQNNISTGIHYPIALSDLPAYSYLNQCGAFQASKISKEILSLPMGEHLEDEEVDFVIDKVRDFFN